MMPLRFLKSCSFQILLLLFNQILHNSHLMQPAHPFFVTSALGSAGEYWKPTNTLTSDRVTSARVVSYLCSSAAHSDQGPSREEAERKHLQNLRRAVTESNCNQRLEKTRRNISSSAYALRLKSAFISLFLRQSFCFMPATYYCYKLIR